MGSTLVIFPFFLSCLYFSPFSMSLTRLRSDGQVSTQHVKKTEPAPHAFVLAPVLWDVTHKVGNHDHCCSFLQEQQFAECVLREISGACVDTKLRGIEGTYIVSGGRDNHKPILKVIGTAERKGLACETRVNVLANTLNDITRSKAH